MPDTPNDTIQASHLHIVCLDVPYPVDYGGVFDLFYKIRSLSEAGIKIHLHCYEYGRGRHRELNEYCEEVFYYARSSAAKSFFGRLPYIVASRASKQLLQRLRQDDHPVLMEGIHCTYFVHSGQLDRKRCFVRLHNVEHLYYKQLAQTARPAWKKIYFARESRLLKRYERSLKDKADFWTVTTKDLEVFTRELGFHTIGYLPLYLPEYKTVYAGEKGSYCLYHGNLSVPENEAAAIWLLEEIFCRLDIPFVIAGKNPSARLRDMAHAFNHTCIVANPAEDEMLELIKKAQLNVLPSLNETGIKLKLVNALYHGRHCVVNKAGVEGSGLDGLCIIANNATGMLAAIEQAFQTPFTRQQYEERMSSLGLAFNNQKTAAQMIRQIFGDSPAFHGSTPG